MSNHRLGALIGRILLLVSFLVSMWSSSRCTLAALELEWAAPAAFSFGASSITGLKLDAATNAFILSSAGSNYPAGYGLAKFDPAGHRLWTIEGVGEPSSLAVNAKGESAVAGAFGVAKFTPSGQLAWLRADLVGLNGSAVAFDKQGNVVVPTYGHLLNLSPEGTTLWDVTGDSGYGLKLDGEGNVIAQGLGTVAKYSSNGQQLWQRTDLRPLALTVDTRESVYVAGNPDTNIHVTKCSPAGDIQWQALYISPGFKSVGDSDFPVAISLDKFENVFVTGMTYGWGFNVTALKFDAAGQRQWVSRSEPGFVEGSVVSSEGDCYVSVYILPPGQNRWPVLKFDPIGTIVWRQQLTNSWNGVIAPHALLLPAPGELLIAGLTVMTNSQTGPILLRCRDVPTTGAPTILRAQQDLTVMAGTELRLSPQVQGLAPLEFQWRRNGQLLESETNSILRAPAVEPGDAGEYSVTIENGLGSIQSAIATVVVATLPVIQQQPESNSTVIGGGIALSLSASGTSPLQYQWRFNGVPIFGADSISLNFTNVQPLQAGAYDAVISSAAGSVTTHVAQVTLFTQFRQAWSYSQESTVWQSPDRSALALAPTGNVYAGFAGDLMASDSGGKVNWSRTLAPTAHFGITSTGDLIVSGYQADFDGLPVWGFSMYSPSGFEWWHRTLRDNLNRADFSAALVVGPNGDSYTAGSIGIGSTNRDLILVRFDASGQESWRVTYDNTNHLDDLPAGLAVDARDNVYVAATTGSFGQSDVLTIKYSPTGKLLWWRTSEGSAHRSDSAAGVALDRDGNVFVASASIRTNGYAAFRTLKYTLDGALLWAMEFDAGEEDYLMPGGIVTDAFGNVVVAGWAQSSLRSYYLTIKYSGDGQELWSRRFSPATAPPVMQAFAMNDAGTVCLTGLAGTIAYSPEGEVLWSDATQPGSSIALGADGSTYVGHADGYRRGLAKYEPVLLGGRFLDISASNSVRVSFLGAAGFHYLIESSVNLRDWTLTTNMIGRGTLPVELIENRQPGSQGRFYRASRKP